MTNPVMPATYPSEVRSHHEIYDHIHLLIPIFFIKSAFISVICG